MMDALHEKLSKSPQVDLHFGRQISGSPDDSLWRSESGVFDWLLDCRGVQAETLRPIRGVRGEALLLHAPQVELKRAIRILHPRYAIYIVPRGGQHYYVGATQIENEHRTPISVRSCLELLSATYAAHPQFSEASVVSQYVGIRPAFQDHLPRIDQKGRYISINGLFRHGYLVGPVICEELMRIINDQPSFGFREDIFEAHD